MSLVTAYTPTGAKVLVPAQWVGHPTLGPNLSSTPPAHDPKPREQPRPRKRDEPQPDAPMAAADPSEHPEKEIENAEDYR